MKLQAAIKSLKENSRTEMGKKKKKNCQERKTKSVVYYPTGIGFIFIQELNWVILPFIVGHQSLERVAILLFHKRSIRLEMLYH